MPDISNNEQRKDLRKKLYKNNSERFTDKPKWKSTHIFFSDEDKFYQELK